MLQADSSLRAKTVLFDPLPENLLRQPIDYLMAEHHRQTKLCDLLEQIRDDPRSEASHVKAAAVLGYMAVDLPRHVADEEALFDRLARRCTPDDKADALIDLLREDHATDRALLAETAVALEAAGSPDGADALPTAVAVFAETKRRHIRLEDAFLLPLARARLKPADLRALGRMMAERRAVPYPD